MSTLKRNTLSLAFVFSAALFNGVASVALADDAAAPVGKPSPLLCEALEAHGGLDTWRSYARMDYATRDFPLGANAPFNFTQTTDLQNRRHVTTGEGFTAGKDGDTAWASPNVEALGLPPAFFESGNFYFITMPFVFADPGVISRDLEPTTFQGKVYDRVAIAYETGVGRSFDDDYVLYIEADTRRLRMIDFVVTDTAVNGDTPKDQLPRKALVFDDWQESGGLLIPGKATFYGWADGQLQGEGNTYYVDNVSFSKKAPEQEIFQEPTRVTKAH